MASLMFFHDGLGVVRRGPSDGGARGPPPQGGGGGRGGGRTRVSKKTSVAASTTDSMSEAEPRVRVRPRLVSKQTSATWRRHCAS
jgi:hypothetical protein